MSSVYRRNYGNLHNFSESLPSILAISGPVITLASVNQTSVREVCAENREAPCDDTVFDWLHTIDRGWLEFAANLLFMQLDMTILDRSGSRIVMANCMNRRLAANSTQPRSRVWSHSKTVSSQGAS